MSILENAQTYIGVLATFVVLCLFSMRNRKEVVSFASKENEEQEPDNANFIYSLIRHVGMDSAQILSSRIENLKASFSSTYDRMEGGKPRYSAVMDRAKDKPSFIDELAKTKIEFQSRLSIFFTEAKACLKVLEGKTQMEKKEELTYVSLQSLLLIVLFMFLDVFDVFPLEIRCYFVNIVISTAFPFSFFLFLRYMKDAHLKAPVVDYLYRRFSKFEIVVKAIVPFLVWMIIICFVDNKVFSALTLPVCMGLFYVFGIPRLLHQLLVDSSFSRSFILRITVFMLGLALVLCVLIHYMTHLSFAAEWLCMQGYEHQIEMWNDNIRYLSEPSLARIEIILFFSFSIFFGPIIVGYSYIQKKSREVQFQIREIYERHSSSIKAVNDKFDALVLKMDSELSPDSGEKGV